MRRACKLSATARGRLRSIAGFLQEEDRARREADASLAHALDLPAATCGPAGWRSVNLPGVCVSVAQMVAALERAGGDSGLIEFRRDPAIEAIVRTIPANFSTPTALALGFPPTDDLDTIVASHIDGR